MTTRKRAETETLEARYRRYRSILKDLTIMSDVFMRNVLKQKACTEYILRVILERNDLTSFPFLLFLITLFNPLSNLN